MEHQEENEARAERASTLVPRIYVASLSDYNAGRLQGIWLDADDDPDTLKAEVDQMLARSREALAEEYAVHDYEGFGPIHLDEFVSIEVAAHLAAGLMEHGMAFGHWAALVGFDDDELDRFESCYHGHWESLSAWAEDLVDDLGVHQEIEKLPVWIQPYVQIDYAGLGRDLATEWSVAEDQEGVYVFDAS